jgi:hypothetical protein
VFSPRAVLEKEAILNEVTAEAGPGEWPGLPTDEALDVLLGALRAEARLSSLGQFAAHHELVHCLVVQRRAAALTVPGASVGNAIVIGGLPRTGTTLLHHLLASHRELMAPLAWQSYRPTALIEDRLSNGAAGAVKRAQQETELRFSLLDGVAPKVCEMHPMAWTDPEECTPLLAASLLCLQLLMTYRIPTFAEWYFAQPLDPVYRFWASQTAAMNVDSEPRRFALKSPLHLVGYESLLKIASASSVIQIRRNYADFLVSFLNMVEAARSIYSNDIAPEKLGREWLGYLSRVLDRAEQASTEHRDRILTIDYPSLARDPVGGAARVCDWLAIDPVPATSIVPAYQALTSRQFAYKRIVLDQFGISDDTARQALEPHLGGGFLLA